jgi:predicted outer membrane lipoprotein
MNEKLDLGKVLERVWETYRDQFGLLIPAALVVYIPVAIVNGIILSAAGVLGALLAAAVGIVATFWFQGMVVEAARDIMDGRRDHTVGSLFQSVAPVIGMLIGAGLLAGIAIFFGFILLIVPGLFLLTIFAVVAPVVVLERPGVSAALSRSRELVRGHGWQVFLVILVLFFLQIVLGGIVGAIFVGIADNLVGRGIADLIVRVFVSPLSALAAAIMYFELKRLHGEPVLGGGAPTEAAPTAPAPSQPPPGAPPPGASEPPRPSAPPPGT